MNVFCRDVLKIALGTALGGLIALFGFIVIIEFVGAFAPWLFRIY